MDENCDLLRLNVNEKAPIPPSHAGHFKTHLTRHSGEKSNKCNQCNYVFSGADQMTTHLSTHTANANAACVTMHPVRQVT